MSTREQILHHYDRLPAHAQAQVFHYIMSLQNDVDGTAKPSEIDLEYQAKLRQLIRHRKVESETTGESYSSDEVVAELSQRFGWSL